MDIISGFVSLTQKYELLTKMTVNCQLIVKMNGRVDTFQLASYFRLPSFQLNSIACVIF